MRYSWCWMMTGLMVMSLSACSKPKAAPPAAAGPAPAPVGIAVDPSTFQFQFNEDHGKTEDIPRWIRDLDGKDVVIEGFMIPLDSTDQVSAFALIKNKPVKGSIPPLQQVIICKTVSGKAMNYYADRLRVYGKMHVGVEKQDGVITNLYTVDASSVRAAEEPATTPSTTRP